MTYVQASSTPKLEAFLYEVVNTDGKRTVRFSANLTVPAAVRQNKNTRWRKNGRGGLTPAAMKAQLYNERRGMIRDILRLYMHTERIKPFSPQAMLELSCVITLNPKRGPLGRMIDDPGKLDIDNLVKGLTDALQWRRDPDTGLMDELLIPNDNQVWQYGKCRKYQGEDEFAVILQEL